MDKSLGDRDKQLLKKIAIGDEEAFVIIFHAWRNKLYFFILRIVENSESAEDIVQDIFVKLWQDRAKLTQVDNLGAYLFRMAQNQAISGMRRMAHYTLIIAELKKDIKESGVTVDDSLSEKQLYDKLQDIIERLPPRQKAIYKMSREEGMKQDEIANRLGISISTIQNHMTAALSTIKQKIHDLLQ